MCTSAALADVPAERKLADVPAEADEAGGEAVDVPDERKLDVESERNVDERNVVELADVPAERKLADVPAEADEAGGEAVDVPDMPELPDVPWLP